MAANRFTHALDTLGADEDCPLEHRFVHRGVHYVVREPLGEAVRLWRNALVRDRKFGPDGMPTSFDGAVDSDALLISFCMRKVSPTDPSTETPLTPKDILALPNKVVDAVFAWVRWAAGFEDEDTAEDLDRQIADLTRRRDAVAEKGDGGSVVKNGQSATTVGSA